MQTENIQFKPWAKTLNLPIKLALPGLSFDKKILRQALNEVLLQTPFTDQNQICFHAKSLDNQNIFDGIGSLWDSEKNQWRAQEKDYQYFIEMFKNTYFHDIYQQLQNVLPVQLGRARLMRLKSRSCYSIHQDSEIRLHIAIHTHSQAFLLIQPAGLVHIPSDGKVYLVNTTHFHTALNGGLAERIHFVINVLPDPDCENKMAQYLGLK